VERRIELPGSTRLLGAQWIPDDGRLTFLDAEGGQVTTLDGTGKLVSSLGRVGEGPGEFRFSPVYIGSRQKFRAASTHRVMVLDDRWAQIFDGVRPVRQVRLDSLAPVLGTDAHVARVSGGWVVSLARRGQAAPAGAGQVRLFLVSDTSTRSVAVPIARVKNVLGVYLPTAGSITAAYPYERLFRRTWDASGHTLALISYRHFAVCFRSIGAPDFWQVWSLTANRRRVDASERDRVLRERFGRSSGPIPIAGGRIEDQYLGKWPAFAPYYHDIMVLNDSTYATLRLSPIRGTTADLFSVGRGYLGSVSIPDGRGAIAGYDRGIMLFDFANGAIDFLRVVIP
jgi:hypothetical protein